MDIISELNGKRILIWGYGREGKATEHFLQRCVKPASVDIFDIGIAECTFGTGTWNR